MSKWIFVVLCAVVFNARAQNLSGQFSSQNVLYAKDRKADAVLPDERIGSNSFLKLQYTKDEISTGVRMENYSPALQGFDPRFNQFGLVNKFVTYQNNDIRFTVGDIYEQFGEGLALRSYWDWNLGFDNAIEGVFVQAQPISGLLVKGIVGKQRFYFSKSAGIIRGVDVVYDLMSLRRDSLPGLFYSFNVGASVVSKFEEDSNPIYNLPENVPAICGRLNFTTNKLTFNSEIAYKINDPSFVNNLIYKDGNAQYVNASYSMRGFGFNITYKRVDNFDFRSQRSAAANDLFINYLPAITQNQTYNLFNLYPYFTQTMGEQGLDVNMDIKLKRGTKLGGKYGSSLHINVSQVYGLKTKPSNEFIGYEVEGIALGDSYYEFVQVELSRKFNTKWQSTWNCSYFSMNNDVLRLSETKGTIEGVIGVLELNYNQSSTNNFRTELQGLFSRQDKGSWLSLMVEYTFKRKLGVSLMDNYNYETYNGSPALHYPSINVFYKKDALNVVMGYGRQNAGALCVGGVCRFVPAYTGGNISFTYSF